MKRFLPSIIAYLAVLLVYYFIYQPDIIENPSFLFLVAVVTLFLISHLFYLFILKDRSDKQSIIYVIGFTGISMFMFLGFILSYKSLTKLELTMKPALLLFFGYLAMKISLILSVVQKKA